MDENTLIEILNTKLSNWSIREGKLYLEIKTKDWNESMGIANMISFLAETTNHHPDLTIRYTTVTIELFTHSSGDITDKDLLLAQKVNDFLSIKQ